MPGDQMVRLLRQRIDLKRITADAYDAAPVASVATSFSRTSEFYVQGALTGFSEGTGTTEIIGTSLAGDSISTTLTFTANQRRQDVKTRFTNITFVNTTGLTNESTVGNLRVTAVSRTGQPDEQFSVIRTNIPARFSGLRENEFITSTGGKETVTAKVFVSTDGDFDRRDKVVFRDKSYNIRAIRKIYSRESLRDHRVLLVGAEDQL